MLALLSMRLTAPPAARGTGSRAPPLARMHPHRPWQKARGATVPQQQAQAQPRRCTRTHEGPCRRAPCPACRQPRRQKSCSAAPWPSWQWQPGQAWARPGRPVYARAHAADGRLATMAAAASAGARARRTPRARARTLPWLSCPFRKSASRAGPASMVSVEPRRLVELAGAVRMTEPSTMRNSSFTTSPSVKMGTCAARVRTCGRCVRLVRGGGGCGAHGPSARCQRVAAPKWRASKGR